MDNKINIACSQLLEIIKYLPAKEFKKIPDEIIDKLHLNSEKNYDFIYNHNKSFKEQGVLEETRILFSNIYNKYLINPNAEAKVQTEQTFNNDIFINNITKRNRTDNSESNLPIKIKHKSFWSALWSYIKKLWS